MDILILSKRQYLGKDLLDDRYWRFFEMAAEMFNQGHTITGVCLSYRARDQGKILSNRSKASSLDWHSVNIGKLLIPGLIKYLRLLVVIITNKRPDIIFVGSDVYHIIFASWLANRYSIPYVVDLYDNFESFSASKVPGVIPIFRKAVGRADGVVCVSEVLSVYVNETCTPSGEVIVVENGVPTGVFSSLCKSSSRKHFDIPEDCTVIGTAGAISNNRGIDVLFKAFNAISKHTENVYLVIAGAKDDDLIIPAADNVIYLGEISYQEIPLLLNTFDVGVICNLDTDFGRYCFPQKAHEMIACDIPVVAANVGSMAEMLQAYPGSLFNPGDYLELEEKIKSQLQSPQLIDIEIQYWDELTDKVLHLIGKSLTKRKI